MSLTLAHANALADALSTDPVGLRDRFRVAVSAQGLDPDVAETVLAEVILPTIDSTTPSTITLTVTVPGTEAEREDAAAILEALVPGASVERPEADESLSEWERALLDDDEPEYGWRF